MSAQGRSYGLGITVVTEPNDSMAATQAAINRQPYPLSSYQTPQSNSPASIHSPQTDAHGRPMYQMPPMAQQMYYQYPIPQQQQPPYTPQQSSAPQHPSLTSAPGMLVSHQPPQQPQQQQHPLSQPPQQHVPGHQQQPSIDTKPPSNLQRPPSVVNQSHGGPQTPSGPAPGPIPATTPLVVRQDNNGVQWIAFEYSRDRVKMEYTIRCDVESVNVEELSPEFKSNNCVYPRACVGKDTYKGNRLHYESECNAVGWALAQLNPVLREKRGLIQRAVDSWRNSNQDVRLRSRRVRRMAKVHNRKVALPPAQSGPVAGPQAPASAGLPPQAGNEYNNSGPAHHHQAPIPTRHGHGTAHPDLSSSNQPRYAHNFYPQYAPPQSMPGAAPPALPPVHDSMVGLPHSPGIARPLKRAHDEDDDEKRALFGELPDAAKRRKFILVEDQQRGTRVRVRAELDLLNMDDMPDAHLKVNAVYPRSYYPRQMSSPPGSPSGRGRWDDEDDEAEGVSGTLPTRGKTMVTVSLMDGGETQMAVPRMTKSRRDKEVKLNNLGYLMAWGQARTFSGRTLFLQRSLDAYRAKMRSSMISAGKRVSEIPPHFELRPGKMRWEARAKRAKRPDGE